ncbi:DUF6928 family protein [Corynebacterium halotolerans]|uniref:Uncharacterized protein n=1 Tax=Corynebacterium halotolerans YIM 70093 = DSM 44683 TaxID=1121362 RepID=M1NWF9_9CORY|nr:hypothetical protein [Corynebacterium halotolerans]AGF71830.1 hypothetical protein A605_04095 [Corynebacterium halotolerans YIM 70093 = DSM 44683]
MDAVVTLWFVTTADPARVLAAEPRADRGFGRKYLAQLNPAWPITPIGQFPLNRSAQASTGEFYIAGFPGVTVVQTVLEDTPRLSELDPRLLGSLPAADVYAFAVNEGTGYGGFAHWHGGELKRSLCALRHELFEDSGLPHPFESPYWAGERADRMGGISLPFEPVDLVAEAQRAWLGVDISPEGPDINIVAYAVDGRPEPKVGEPPHARHRDVGELASAAAAKLGLGAGRGDYDDYEDHSEEGPSPRSAELARLADASTQAARRAGRGLVRRLKSAREYLDEKLRHSDRP